MGPDPSKRMEQRHGFDTHPNGIPPNENPPDQTFPVECPKCKGTGTAPISAFRNSDESCGMCNGWGEIDFTKKVRVYLRAVFGGRPFG